MKRRFILLLVITVVFGLFLGFDVMDNSPKGSRSGVTEFTNIGPTVQSDNSVELYRDDMDGANDTTALKSRGYHIFRNSPIGSTAAWFQGNDAVFPAFNGPTTGYTAANYNAVTGANNIDTWLILPVVAVDAGDTLSFVSRAPAASTFPDSIRVMYSAVGDSTPGGSWTELGRFKVNILGIWELKAFTAPTAGPNGRFAIRYNVVNGGPSGTNSDFIGIDAVVITEGPGGGPGPEPQMSLNHTPGLYSMGIFNNGSVGKESQTPFAGPGVKWDGTDGCFTGGVIYGTSGLMSCNGNIGSFGVADMKNVASDFAGGFTSDADFNQISTALLYDSAAALSYGLQVIQKSYSDTLEEYGYVRYGFINTTALPVTGLHAGLFMDWDIGSATVNSGGYAPDRRMVYNFDTGPGLNYYGLAALDGVAGMRTTTAGATLTARTEAYNNISVDYTDSTLGAPGDFRTWIGTSVGTIAPGDTAWTTFAVLAGVDLAQIRQQSEDAQNKALALGWITTVGINPISSEVPDGFSLSQNYPNPFNPSTKIAFDIPTQGFVTLKVYDVLGKEVATLVNDITRPGSYDVTFDASRLSSGIYFYKLQTEGFVQTKRMVLLK